ncbi:MAG: mannose-1-phosphate guanylyltransferase [Alphaproteobacteria bacterium]|nr:mannose-1-phosphate guanylyltransferase [Alphaproteobacteria bacterium]
MTSPVIPVILCGGSGTRLWPASRDVFPKQFLNLFGEDTLLQTTLRRALRITKTPADHVITVTLAALEDEARRQISNAAKGADTHILKEPVGRNTAAAIAFAALYVRSHFGPKALMWVLPSDHYIGDEDSLAKAFQKGLLAAQKGKLVTFGITPTRPDTGYGYIKHSHIPIEEGVYAVADFEEKPNRTTAEAFLASGKYLWNSGMFLFEAQSVLDQFSCHAPVLLAKAAAAMTSSPDAQNPHCDSYAEIPAEPFDKAIMEKTDEAAIVPCDPNWSDIGSWESLWEIGEKDLSGNVIEGQAVTDTTKGCLIQSNGHRLVACAGLENLVIVDTGDTVLIADRTNHDSIRALIKKLNVLKG